jgi:Fic family protein
MSELHIFILPAALLPEYLESIPDHLLSRFDALHDAELSAVNFSFYTSVASVFSSKIEGEKIELDSYIKHKRDGILFQPDYTKKVDDLYDAYMFAKENVLNPENLSKAHKLLSRNLLGENWQGVFRKQNMYVTTPDGKIEYMAASPFEVESEMQKLYADIDTLLKAKLSLEETFFFASMIHLVFVKIHPWNDGNGRSARLLEKWFLGQKLGEKAWFVQSEKYYYQQHETYFNNIRALGLEYPELNYSKALPFLLMLPESVVAPK